MNKAILLLLIVMALSLPGRVQGAIITADGFNINGSGSVTISGDGVKAVAVQPWDRKIIIGGSFTLSTGGASPVTRSNLARLNFDGSLDTAFTAEADGPVNAIVIQLDKNNPDAPDKNPILTGGSFTSITWTPPLGGLPQQVNRKGVAQLSAVNGLPTPFDPGTGNGSTVVNAIAVDPATGSIVLGGSFTEMAASPCRNIARVSSGGAFQSDFSKGVTGGAVYAIVVLEGSRTVAGGSFSRLVGDSADKPHGYLAKFDDRGVPDTSFVPAPSGTVRALALQPDGSLIMGGDFSSVNAKERLHLARVDGDGDLDGFDPGIGGSAASVAAVAMQPDGKILIGGSFDSILHPSGAPVLGEVTATRKGVARLRLNGAVEDGIDPAPDAAVSALAVQPDGKFLIAGGFASVFANGPGPGKPRTRLARFYPFGDLDEDVYPIGKAIVGNTFLNMFSLSLDDSGRLTIASGMDTFSIGGLPQGDIFRLSPNWDRVEPLALPHDPTGIGFFTQALDGDILASDGWRVWDLDSDFNVIAAKPFNLNFDFSYGSQWAWQTEMADMIVTPDNKFYLGGSFIPAAEEETNDWPYPGVNLRRISRDGIEEGSTTFHPPAMAGSVTALALQPDPKYVHKLLVGTRMGILRLLPTGDPDPDFIPMTDLHFGGKDQYPDTLVPRPDGKILVGGQSKTSPLVAAGATWSSRYLLLLNNNGKVDTTFRVDTKSSPTVPGAGAEVVGVHLQVDGKMIIAGLWESIMDSNGPPQVMRGTVARLDQTGILDDFDVGTVESGLINGSANNSYKLTSSLLTPDGKLILAGDYLSINGNTERRHLSRIAVGSVTETLSVSPDGKQITWKRGGVAPEASWVFFEWSADGSDGSWQPIGSGSRIEGGWQIDCDLGTHGWNENHYVRARALLAGDARTHPIHSSVLLYYLRPLLTVQARSESRYYGDDNPTFIAQYLRSGAPVKPESLDGAPELSTTAVKLSPAKADPYPINVSLSNLSSWRYRFELGNTGIRVDPRPITVTASPHQYKLVGGGEPVLAYGWTPALIPPDNESSFSGILEWDHVDTAGPHPITVGSLKLNDNYAVTFKGDLLTVVQPGNLLSQKIDFPQPPDKTYGDSDFDPGATTDSGLTVSYASSNSLLAEVVGEKIRVRSPGTESDVSWITASQGGDTFHKAANSVALPVTVHPAPGNALSFDGMDDLLQIPHAPQLNFDGKGQGFTVEAWLQLKGHQQDGAGLVAKGTAGDAWRGFQLLLIQDRIAAEFGVGFSTVGAPAGLWGSTSMNDGDWHHVALSVDRASSTAALYLDGKLEARVSDPHFGSDLDNAEPVRVGVERGGQGHFRGSLDELRVWDTARSVDQIRSAAGFILDPPAEPHLMAYYHFDQGIAEVNNAGFLKAPERTANGVNGNDGVLSGFALAGAESNWVASKALLPLVDTYAFVRTAGGHALGGGFVSPNLFGITTRGVCWSTDPYPRSSDYCVGSGQGDGAFPAEINLLEDDRTYYIRAYATNAVGTAFGNQFVLRPVGQGKQEQSISFALPGKTYGDPEFAPGATASSRLAVSYASSDQRVAVIVNGMIRIVGAGDADITATQGGDDSYNAAPPVIRTLKVARASLTVSADYKARAFLTPNPPLTVSYRGFVNGEGSQVLSGTPVLSTAAVLESPVGDYEIKIDVAPLSSRNYQFSGVKGILSVVKSCQQIIFPLIGEKTYGDPPFELIAYSCSGLPIGFTSSNPQAARVDGNLVTVTGAGSTVITASQPGSGDTEPAPDLSQTLLVHRSRQEVSFPDPPRKVLGDPPFPLLATASSGLPVSYQSSDPAVAVVSGNLVTIVGPGTTALTANQTGDANYDAALPVSRPLTVAAEGDPPALALSMLATGSVTANPVLNVAGSAGDPSGIASLTVNDQELAQEAALFSTALALRNGENSIKVTATDGAGNKQSREIGVTFDAAAPLVELTGPADNSVTDASLFRISGTAAQGSSVTLSVNGGAAQTAQIEDGAFSASGYLREGLNTLEVTAELAGRSSTVKRSVTLSFDKPSVAITEPPEDLRTEKESITVAGVAVAQGGAVTLELSADGSGVPVSLQEGGFRREIPLHEGENRIRATVTGGSGSSSTASRNVLRYRRVLGDLNGDGLVDVRDVLIALRISLGIEAVTPEALSHGDVAPLVEEVPQPDGRIDVGDVLVLLRKVVGLVEF
jgi:uncharacterized delta-60 repeat protein